MAGIVFAMESYQRRARLEAIFYWCTREYALSLGKQSTFPDWVSASRTPSHYEPRIQPPRPPHFRLPSTHKSLRTLRLG